jgi:hypothetical protein
LLSFSSTSLYSTRALSSGVLSLNRLTMNFTSLGHKFEFKYY